MSTKITKTCEQCQTVFCVRLAYTKRKPAKGISFGYGRFCSRTCWTESRKNRITLTCTNCLLQFDRTPSEINRKKKKSERYFCSQSCAAKYNNAHKTTGTRRSKLESYLEKQLRAEFPSLVLICNGKDAIGSELDFYFPQLRLAIELNGIFHYEPIYGADKLEQIQANDQQKSIACNQAGIEFCTIDTSTVNHITTIVKERYWTIVRSLVTPLLGRADDTIVQVS